ncbi:hypothetical protein K9M47_03295 [Candidatus Gracilibacteria bacterium]|nr:hypothetical protein [Candidatus Gracilibacteria bacterium]
MEYEILNNKIRITKSVPNVVKDYEPEDIKGIIENIEREYIELQSRIDDNRARYAIYSVMLPSVEEAIINKRK